MRSLSDRTPPFRVNPIPWRPVRRWGHEECGGTLGHLQQGALAVVKVEQNSAGNGLWRDLIQGKVQFQNVNSRLAQKSELPGLRVLANRFANHILAQFTLFRNARGC